MIYLFHAVAFLVVTWWLYLAGINLLDARAAKTLHPVALVLGSPILVVGYCLDVFYNVLLFMLLFWDIPKELTITQRLRRYKAGPDGKRKKLAMLIANIFLNPFVRGGAHV